MKTFDEALRSVAVLVDGDPQNHPAAFAAAFDTAKERLDRVRSIVDEAHNSTELDDILIQTADALDAFQSDSPGSLRRALHVAMEIGLRIGIEMERQELPGMEREPSPPGNAHRSRNTDADPK